MTLALPFDGKFGCMAIDLLQIICIKPTENINYRQFLRPADAHEKAHTGVHQHSSRHMDIDPVECCVFA